MEQTTRVFCQFDVQEFRLSKYLLFGCAAKQFFIPIRPGFLCLLFKTASSPAPSEDAGLEPRTIRHWHWQSDALTTRLDHIHSIVTF